MPVTKNCLVEKEYEKNENLREEIQKLRTWLDKQSHLPHEFITDLDLILAYHSCGNCLESAKNVIDLNYTLRTLITFYQNRTVDRSLENAHHTWLMTPLPTPTTNGYRAIYCQLVNPDPHAFVYIDVIRAFVMMIDLWLQEEGTVEGVAVVVNMDSVTMGHLSKIDLAVAQQFFYFLQEAMFIRLREFHFINAPSIVNTLMSMVRPFMKQEMIDMVKVHRVGSDTLDEYISRSALPENAGGKYKDSITLRDGMWQNIKSNHLFFLNESKQRVDESKRPGEPKTLSTFFSGFEGSFKKLEID